MKRALLACLVLGLSLLGASCPSPVPTPPEPPATGGAQATGGSATTGGAEATGGAQAACEYIPSRSARNRSAETPRVVGGEPAPDQVYPWMAALETPTGWQFCGSTVISSRWLLTAAHCQVEPGDVAHVGTVNLTHGGRRIEIAEVRNHPLWNGTTSGHDVAVLRLAADAEVEPVTPADEVDRESAAMVIGWGATAEGGSTTPILQHVEVPLVARELCQIAYAGQIDPTMLCAGSGGQDSCQGDSGGPLVIWRGGWQQIGITSWGRGCARPGVPGVYTSVPAVLEWVEACAR